VARVHDDNPDSAGRGLRRAPASGEVVGRRSRPGPYDSDDDGPSPEDIERFGGATRRCPECRKDVFDDTAVCYHCGHAFEGESAGAAGRPKPWMIATVVVLVLGFLYAALSGLI
jgi:uncharacterized Fe-S cluster protein YjdI